MDTRDDGRSQVLDVQAPAGFDAPSTSAPDKRAKTSKKSFPPVDAHLVVPELTRDEIIKGRKVVAMPALPPHADAQTSLGFLISAHVKPDYIPSTEMLTRVSEGSDFATDVSVRKRGIDPATNERYLEELSFEVVNEQRLRNVTDKADELAKRGVRRIFAIFIKRDEVGEWSSELRKFVIVDKNAALIDEALVRPIPFKALIEQALADDEVVKALVAKKNPEIMRLQELNLTKGRDEGLKQGLVDGRLDGRRETLLEQLEEQFGQVPNTLITKVRAAGIDELRIWSKKLLSSDSIEEVFSAP